MKFEIIPYDGAGMIKLGMNDKQVHKVLQLEPQKFKKSLMSSVFSDAYPFCHLYYKENGECEAIEFFGTVEVSFQGRSLLETPYEELRRLFGGLDSSVEEDETGLISFKYGISIYSSDLQSVEGVLVFEERYYD